MSPSQKAIITHTTIYLIPLLNDFQYTHSKTPNIPHKAFFSSFYYYYDGPVSGNANFNMPRTCLTLCGMTQPTTAFRLIVDKNNFSKGLASRFLWIFPRPVFSNFSSLQIHANEECSTTATEFTSIVGKVTFLSAFVKLHMHHDLIHHLFVKASLQTLLTTVTKR